MFGWLYTHTHTHTHIWGHIYFSIDIGAGTLVFVLISWVWSITHFIMNSPQLGEDNSDNELYKDFLKLGKNYKISNKELKKVK